MKPISDLDRLAAMPQAAKQVAEIVAARTFVCKYRPDAVQSITFDKKQRRWVVAIYDVRISVDKYGFIGKQVNPQLLGDVFTYNEECFDVTFAAKAWISAANFIYALERGIA
jgi:hypothetical protein